MINIEAMNSVSEEKHRRRFFILTKDVMAGIPVLVAQGMKAPAIADRLGCKLGTLKVRCSQVGISLRRPGAGPGRGRGRAIAMRLSDAALARFRKHAAAIGVREAKLASDLMEVIAQDDLYDAILDTKEAA
jgi:hypothetical protein